MVAYCDYIAHLVQQGLREDSESLLKQVSPTKLHLGENGEFISPTKTVMVTDRYGKQYRIRVEEVI